MSGWLDGKRALVVGAGSGIGRGVVDAFLAGGRAGRRARDSTRQVRRPGGRATTTWSWSRATRRPQPPTRLRWPRPSTASVGWTCSSTASGSSTSTAGSRTSTPTMLDQAFDEMFAVNVKLPPAQRSRPRCPRCAQSGGSSCSPSRRRPTTPAAAGASTSRRSSPSAGWSPTLAYELAPEVRVNGVAPGGTLGTDLRGLSTLGLDAPAGSTDPDRAAELAARNPLGVALSGADHAWSYVFLASDRSRGISGRDRPLGRRHGDQGLNAEATSEGDDMPVLKADLGRLPGLRQLRRRGGRRLRHRRRRHRRAAQTAVDEADRVRVEAAARSCPVSALWLEDA